MDRGSDLFLLLVVLIFGIAVGCAGTAAISYAVGKVNEIELRIGKLEDSISKSKGD